jgi:uncharacterized RDD family membrane protein YckC
MPMVSLMNAIAQASAAPTTGPKLDNRRVLAALVDLAIVVAGTVVILFAADALSGDRGDVRGALGAVVLGWALYYYFAMESGDGQTVGKKLLKLRVVRADGRPAGMREIAVRTVLRVVDGVGCYIVGLIVMLATGQRRQRLGDLAAGTIVVDASAPAYVPPAPVVEPVEEEPESEVDPSMDASTITLPSRPSAPATLDDLQASEGPPVPEMRPFDPPLADEEEDEPAVEDEPVEQEPLAADEPVDAEPVDAVEDAAEPADAEPVEVEPVDAFEVAEEPVDAEPVDAVEVAEEPAVQLVEPVEVEDEDAKPKPVAPFEVIETPAVHLVEPVEDEVEQPTVQLVEPLEDEAVEDEPVAEDHPVALAELGDEDAPVADEPLPEISTPALDELAHDVVAARSEPVPVVKVVLEDESDEDEPITLKSVETVSAIDLVMGGAPEADASSELDQDPEPPAAS